jgi:hypothetical protein
MASRFFDEFVMPFDGALIDLVRVLWHAMKGFETPYPERFTSAGRSRR